MKKVILASFGAALLAPFMASAVVVSDVSTLASFFIDLVNTVFVPILFALAFVVFIWGAFTTFILGATSDEVKDKGKSLMLWGLIGFFVMISIWGLVNLLTGTVQFTNNAGPSTRPAATL